MQYTKKFLPGLALTILILASCNSNDSSIANAKRKAENDSWVNSFKDSIGYVKDSVSGYYGNIIYYHKIIQAGTGSTSPIYTDLVKVNYKGTTKDGTVFDKTYSGDSPLNDATAVPVTFYANQLVYGWTVNLIQMKVGEIRRIILPSELAYGGSGAGTAILPYTALKFDIQLISFSH